MQRRQAAPLCVTWAAGVGLSIPEVASDRTINVALLGAAIAGAARVFYRGSSFLGEAHIIGSTGLNVLVGRRISIGGAT
ncbi:MAG: hypothetical protein ABFC89_05485 [Methanospirillum sp.]